MANIFERLLQLYKIQKRSEKTPLEDFVTELVAGILQTDQQLLDRFVNEVLQIEGDGFKVDSQVRYAHHSDQNCIIDLVFENEATICFLENKVASGEGERQLKRYAEVLTRISEESGKKTYLRYCTKFYDPKTMAICSFYQFRWQKVYEFLEKQEQTEIINAFLELLRGEKMAGVKDFSIEDIVVMKGFQGIIAKMDEVLDLARVPFLEHFGQPYQRDYERLKQIPSNNRYSLWTSSYRGEDIEIMIGFEMESVKDNVSPVLFVQVYRQKNKEFAAKMQKQSLGDSDKFDYYQVENNEVYAWYETSLLNFLTENNQKERIVDWFSEKLAKTKGIIDSLYR
ncbi:PD-(D/E)XK nuclease superfamily protein [Ureibacillus xyleni]|uniref:PD-(D/E)XK nuclease superfamily protein n=1 Tax=Ureibacillus xyleni TaxID=614648 RepID=A0A285T2K0_9BACL|nr:PD-(D/E)XK nuclease family protein [Ureibacillus xyleni]SOC13446.1 PD-(D/E)XK nuclease superfamily protein [Ureibacillus xyleni]